MVYYLISHELMSEPGVVNESVDEGKALERALEIAAEIAKNVRVM